MPKQGSKSGRSSKTARVLNLLTDPDSVEKSVEQDSSSAQKAAVDEAKLADDRRTQAKIRGALEEELANMPKPKRPRRPRPAADAEAVEPPAVNASEEHAPAKESVSPAVFPVAQAPAADAAPDEPPVRPVPELTPMPLPVFTVSAPMPAASPLEAAVSELRSASEKDPDEYICYNITQTLVEDKADKYIKMFNLCPCKRCRIDVIALALSNLPPKYVVARPHELIPRLSMYEQKYNAAVVTQVMSACKKVLDRPHHSREKK